MELFIRISMAITAIVICALLNRLRGTEEWRPEFMKGRSLFYVAPVMGLVAIPWHSVTESAAIAVGYFFWGLFGWGHVLMQVGGRRPDRSPDVVEAALLMLPGPLLPLFARMLFILPCVAALAYLSGDWLKLLYAPAFAAAAVAVYTLLFRPISSHDWLRGELAVGALWGVFIVLS